MIVILPGGPAANQSSGPKLDFDSPSGVPGRSSRPLVGSGRGAGFGFPGRRDLPTRRPVDQFPIDLGAHGRFNDGVVDIARDARLGAQFDPIARLDVALDVPFRLRWGRSPSPRCSPSRSPTGTRGLQLALHVAVDMAVEMQAAGEFDVAVDARLGTDQGVDLRCLYSVSV